MQATDFSYQLSSEIPLQLRFRIISNFEPCKLKCQIFSNSKPLTLSKAEFSTGNDPFQFELEFAALPLTALVRIETEFGVYEFLLFNSEKELKQGLYKLRLYDDISHIDDRGDQLQRLLRKYHRGDIPKIDWLDNLSLKIIDQELDQLSTPDTCWIQLPIFDFPVVFNEQEYSFSSKEFGGLRKLSQIGVWDPELMAENLVESKHRKLVRSHRHGGMDHDLKPNPEVRDQLYDIQRYPPTQALTLAEKDLLWKFRYHLQKEKKVFL